MKMTAEDKARRKVFEQEFADEWGKLPSREKMVVLKGLVILIAYNLCYSRAGYHMDRGHQRRWDWWANRAVAIEERMKA